MTLLRKIADQKNLEAAYLWCCKAREKFPAHSDILLLRERCARMFLIIQEPLLTGDYHFAPMDGYVTRDGNSHHFWNAIDAVVFKAISIVLSEYLRDKLSPNCCTHIHGHGGMAQAVRKLRTAISANCFFVRSDINGYYASIRHDKLSEQIRVWINDPLLLSLIESSYKRVEYHNSIPVSITQGIPLRSPLSPLLVAIGLYKPDTVMDKQHITYVRFMDDWVILAPTRHRLKKYIRLMYHALNELKLAVHPDKTNMGRIAKGISFLGFIFKHNPRLALANVSINKFYTKLTKLVQPYVNKANQRVLLMCSYFGRYLGWLHGVISGSISIASGVKYPF